MTVHRRTLTLLIILVTLLGGGALYGYRFVTRHTVAVRHIPAAPTLTGEQTTLAGSLAEAEARTAAGCMPPKVSPISAGSIMPMAITQRR